jgi:hypothetical protein
MEGSGMNPEIPLDVFGGWLLFYCFCAIYATPVVWVLLLAGTRSELFSNIRRQTPSETRWEKLVRGKS